MRISRGSCILLMGGVAVVLSLATCVGLTLARRVAVSAPIPHLPTPAVNSYTGWQTIEWRQSSEEMPADVIAQAAPAAVFPETGNIAASMQAAVPGSELRLAPSAAITLPVDGPVSQGFGCSPFYSGIPGPGCPADAFWFHDGVDLAVPSGTPVKSTMSGIVIFAGPDGAGPLCNRGYRGYGLAVVVDGGNSLQTLYAHLSRVDVAAGQVVTPEMVIGASGDTGCVSGAHLHFGLRRDGQLVDPLKEGN
jgi:murein DD-endopeptidase MepM/ murein hydrolase activator NlpD